MTLLPLKGWENNLSLQIRCDGRQWDPQLSDQGLTLEFGIGMRGMLFPDTLWGLSFFGNPTLTRHKLRIQGGGSSLEYLQKYLKVSGVWLHIDTKGIRQSWQQGLIPLPRIKAEISPSLLPIPYLNAYRHPIRKHEITVDLDMNHTLDTRKTIGITGYFGTLWGVRWKFGFGIDCDAIRRQGTQGCEKALSVLHFKVFATSRPASIYQLDHAKDFARAKTDLFLTTSRKIPIQSAPNNSTAIHASSHEPNHQTSKQKSLVPSDQQIVPETPVSNRGVLTPASSLELSNKRPEKSTPTEESSKTTGAVTETEKSKIDITAPSVVKERSTSQPKPEAKSTETGGWWSRTMVAVTEGVVAFREKVSEAVTNVALELAPDSDLLNQAQAQFENQISKFGINEAFPELQQPLNNFLKEAKEILLSSGRSNPTKDINNLVNSPALKEKFKDIIVTELKNTSVGENENNAPQGPGKQELIARLDSIMQKLIELVLDKETGLPEIEVPVRKLLTTVEAALQSRKNLLNDFQNPDICSTLRQELHEFTGLLVSEFLEFWNQQQPITQDVNLAPTPNGDIQTAEADERIHTPLELPQTQRVSQSQGLVGEPNGRSSFENAQRPQGSTSLITDTDQQKANSADEAPQPLGSNQSEPDPSSTRTTGATHPISKDLTNETDPAAVKNQQKGVVDATEPVANAQASDQAASTAGTDRLDQIKEGFDIVLDKVTNKVTRAWNWVLDNAIPPQ